MSTLRKTITITEHQNLWIKSKIVAGDFTNDSEYIRDLIRRDQAGFKEIEAISSALEKGEFSGEPRPFDGDQFKRFMAAKHAGS